MTSLVLHLIANAHIDPVWMWNYREGLNEGIGTCRTMLTLMQEYPQLTFTRGEAAIYEHIERFAPELFRAIAAMVEAGRWEIVGGNYIQPDDNLPATWTALQQYKIGRAYFREKFRQEIDIAWLADAFGHARGVPELFAASGFRYFVFCRPQEEIKAIGSPLFFWRGAGGSELLCNRILTGGYHCERGDGMAAWPGSVRDRLNAAVAGAAAGGLQHHLVGFGLGNHGGGATRRILDDILAWQQDHPEVELRFSSMRRYFAAVERELEDPATRARIPVFADEINFCQRGCAASYQKIKRVFRQAEARIQRSDRTQVLLRELVAPDAMSVEKKAVCFNAFHDIVTGTCIESAGEEQIRWMDHAIHSAEQKEFAALMTLAAQLEVKVPATEYDQPGAVPFLIFNSRPRRVRTFVELEANLDFRPLLHYRVVDGVEPLELRDAAGRPLPFQVIETEHKAMFGVAPWRRRLLVELELPPSSWQVVTLGYRQRDPEVAAPLTRNRAVGIDDHTIANHCYRISARVGDTGIQITAAGQPVVGAAGLQFAVYRDGNGSWGDMSEKPENSHTLDCVEHWPVTAVKVIEAGPERATLFVALAGRHSNIKLKLSLYRDQERIVIDSRLYWQDRNCNLKMLTAPAQQVVYEVPAGRMTRYETAMVPGGRHQKIYLTADSGFQLISDTIYAFENEGGHFAAILARGQRYSTDEPVLDDQRYPEQPICDAGELRTGFVLAAFDADGDTIAEDFEQPPTVLPIPVHAGSWPAAGSLDGLEVSGAKVLDLAAAADGLVLTLQNQESAAETVITYRKTVRTLTLPPWKIIEVKVGNL